MLCLRSLPSFLFTSLLLLAAPIHAQPVGDEEVLPPDFTLFYLVTTLAPPPEATGPPGFIQKFGPHATRGD